MWTQAVKLQSAVVQEFVEDWDEKKKEKTDGRTDHFSLITKKLAKPVSL